MARSGRKQYKLIQHEGGMQSFSAPHYRRDDQAKVMLNWSPRIPGMIEKQRGVEILGTGSASGDPKGIGVFETESGTNSVIRLHGVNVEYWSGAAWTSISTGMHNNNTDIAEIVNAYLDNEERVYIATGFNDPVKFWNGTVFSEIANTYAKHCEIFLNKLYLGNVKLSSTAYPIRLLWSNIGTDVFNATVNYIDDVGEAQTGLKTFASRLHIFSANQLFAFDGSSLRNIPGDAGCTSSRTIQITSTHMYWYNRQGVYEYNGVNIPTLISRPIQDWIDAIPSATATSAWIDKYGRYCLQLGDATITVNGVNYVDAVAIYDPFLKSWSVSDNTDIHSAVRVRSGGILETYGVRYNTNKVYKLDSGYTDLSSASVNGSYESRELGIESPKNRKNFYFLEVTYEPQNNSEELTFSYKLDGGSWVEFGTIVLSGTNDIETQEVRLPAGVTGRIIEIKVEHTANTNAVIQQMILEYDEIKFK